jgi:ankyrin repeat protein
LCQLLQKIAIIYFGYQEGNQGLFSAASLLRAAKAGDIDAVKKNLRGHTGINTQDENGKTALLYAAWKGHNDVVSLLAEAHADVNLPDKDGFTACYTASYSGHTNVVDVLLRHGANPNIALAVEPYSVPLEMAATNGHPQTVERLLEGGALINREELSSTTRDQMELQLSSWPVRRVMRRW